MDSLTHQAMLYSGAGSIYNQSSTFDPNAPLNKLEAAALQIYCTKLIVNNELSEPIIKLVQDSIMEARYLIQQCSS